jgi:hypothetical protein
MSRIKNMGRWTREEKKSDLALASVDSLQN